MSYSNPVTWIYLGLFFLLALIFGIKKKTGGIYVDTIGIFQTLVFSAFILPRILLPSDLPSIRPEELFIFGFLPILAISDSPWHISRQCRLFIGLLLVLGFSVLISTSYSLIIGVPLSYKNNFDLVKVIKYLLIILFSGAMISFSQISLRRVVNVCYVAAFVLIVITLVQYLSWPTGPGAVLARLYAAPTQFMNSYLRDHRMVVTAVDPNMGAQVLFLMFTLMLVLAVNGVRRKLSTIAVLGLLVSIVLTQSRTGLVMVGVVAIVLAIHSVRLKRARLWIRPLCIVFALTVLVAEGIVVSSGFSPSYLRSLGRVFHSGNILIDRSMSLRLTHYWPQVIDQWLQSPLVGWGPVEQTKVNLLADNEYLLTLLHFGLLGLGLLLCFYVANFHLAQRIVRYATDQYRLSFGQSISWAIPAILAGNLTHTMFFDIQSAEIFFLNIGLLIGIDQVQEKEMYPEVKK